MLRRMFCTIVVSCILTILFSTAVYASTYAVVTGSRVNVRAYADIGTNNRLFQVERGTRIEILGATDEFFRAEINDINDVYISRNFVRITETTGTVVTDLPFIFVYNYPTEFGGISFGFILPDEIVTVKSVYGNWFGIDFNGETAFVETSCVEIPYFAFSELPRARVGNNLARELVETAKTYLGTNYRWGGMSPSTGFDCSGFMVYLFSARGIQLNRSSRDQARNGIAITREELEPGDLVFFGGRNNINHVGMYIGNDRYIHSSSNSTGGVIISYLSRARSSQPFVTARRVIL